MKASLQIVILILGLLGTLAKTWVDDKTSDLPAKRRTVLKGLYWAIIVAALVTGILLNAMDGIKDQNKVSCDRRLALGLAEYAEGKAFFLSGLGSPTTPTSLPTLEQAVPLLGKAADRFKDLPDCSFYEMSARTAIALSREKLAYKGAATATIYVLTGDTIIKTTENAGDDIKTLQPKLKGAVIRCTAVVDKEMWKLAGIEYRRILVLLKSCGTFDSAPTAPTPDVMAAIARSAGYYLVCDHILNHAQSLDDADYAFRLILDYAAPKKYNLPERYSDTLGKLAFTATARKGLP